MKKFISFLAALGIITVIFGVIYASVQQDQRQSANDPQIQMAEDTAALLANGGDISQIATTYPHIDFSQSLAPFLIVYDASGNASLFTGDLSGNIPKLPAGVLNYVASLPSGGEDRITWQPALPSNVASSSDPVRIAAVVIAYKAPNGQSGFVLAGRSLREVEKRESKTGEFALIGWILSVIGLLTLFLLSSW